MTDRAFVGTVAEVEVENYLKRHGLSPVMRNYRTPMGEVDLVMKKGDIIVFVEVKYREEINDISALEAITPAKQRRIAKAALSYMNRPGMQDMSMRFDVVTVEAGKIDWIEDAFQAPSMYRR